MNFLKSVSSSWILAHAPWKEKWIFFLPDGRGIFEKKRTFFFFIYFFFLSELSRPPRGEKGGVLHGVSWMDGWIKGKRERGCGDRKQAWGLREEMGAWGWGKWGDHFCPGLMGPLIQLWIRHAYVCVCVCLCVSVCVCV